MAKFLSSSHGFHESLLEDFSRTLNVRGEDEHAGTRASKCPLQQCRKAHRANVYHKSIRAIEISDALRSLREETVAAVPSANVTFELSWRRAGKGPERRWHPRDAVSVSDLGILAGEVRRLDSMLR